MAVVYRGWKELALNQIYWLEAPHRLAVTGDWTLATGEALVQDIISITEKEPAGPLRLDLSGLRFIDSRGISNLLELRKSLSGRKIELTIVNPSPVSLKVFQLISLDRLIPFEVTTPPQ